MDGQEYDSKKLTASKTERIEMRASAKQCDHQQLKMLLSNQLNDAEQSAVATHLESCDECQAELEQLAGDKHWWSEASDFLCSVSDDIGRGETSNHSVSAMLLSTDELGPVEFTFDFLEPSDNPAMIGRLGEYEILELIGRGGMGAVLKGYQRELNRYVAVKVMAPHYASSGAARKRFAREAQAAAAVVHPHVVSIHSVDSTAKLPYLVMPFVAAQSLQMRIDKDGPLETKEILRIGKQAAEGLAAAHAQGLVHRDIKPANILLEDDVGRVLLTDFGLARAVDDATMTRSGVIAGTPQYMAPEQASGEVIDHRADLFSLGSVLYAMCTGHPPFRAETTMGILRRICDSTPRPVCEVNADVPAWLQQIIERLHAKDADERFATAADVAELLGKCLAHIQQPTVVSLPESLTKPSNKNATPVCRTNMSFLARAIGWCTALACLFMAIAFSIGNWFAGDSPPVEQRRVSSQLENELPSTNSSSYSWDDGIAEQLLQLDHDAAELEQQAEQLWHDSSPLSLSVNEVTTENYPDDGISVPARLESSKQKGD